MIRKYGPALISPAVLAACGQASDPAAPDVTTFEEAEAQMESAAETGDSTTILLPGDPNAGELVVIEDDIETIGYPDGWELQYFWSGEYPNGFAVTQEGVTVMGHETITFDVYPPIYCGLPYKATYSPWNSARRESDDLEFVSMVYPTTFTIMEDTSVEDFVGDGTEQLSLSAGDELIYKSYLAEGFFIAEKDGVQYELNESELPESTEFQQGPNDQEWVLVTCDDADKTRAWILYDDAIGALGVEPYEYKGFGEAADLP